MTNKILVSEYKEENRYRLIVENSSDLIVILDMKGNFTFVSPSYETVLGYKKEELLGKNSFSFLHPDDRERVMNEFQKAISGKSSYLEVYRARHKDGSWRYCEAAEGIILSNGGKPSLMVGIARDVTERIKSEQKKDSFISFLSHELKTPLTTVLMLMSFLEKKIPDEHHELTPYYSKLEQQIVHFSQLIQMLVDVSELEQGRLQLKKEEFLLNEFIKEVLQYQIGNGNHMIVVENDEKEKVLADKMRLEEAVNALLLNAIKYSSVDTPITVHVYIKDGYAEVAITDFGLGIPESEQQRIFEKFYQSGDQMQYARPGLGIGLYFAKELIRMHRGDIWVKSERGKGSTFYFSLPLSD